MSILNFISCYEDAWKNLIMPPRQDYSVSSLGPTKFHVKNNRIHRQDFKLSNKRGQMIECSFYQQLDIRQACPCVVYLHTSGGSRIETLEIINLVLANPVCFFSFDFSACGKSEGEYSSVGWFEQEDLECIMNYIQNTGKVSKICLWGRSMGATTALLYSAKHFKAECLILDSPFSDLKLLIQEVAKKNASIPTFVAKVASHMIRKTVLSKADFDIEEIKPIEYITKIRVPALFGVAKDDTFVSPQHSSDLFSAYLGPKKIEYFDGNHSSSRPIQWFKAVIDFLKENLFDDKIVPQQVKHFTASDYQSPRHFSELSQTNIERPHTQQSFTPRQLKFSWLDPKLPQNTSNLTPKPFQSKNMQNSQTVSSFQQAQNKKSSLSFDPTVFMPYKNGYKINKDISDPSIRVDEIGAESFMKTQEMWQSQHEKSPLGPKLTSICPQPSKLRNTKKAFVSQRPQTKSNTPNHKSATLTYKSSTPHPRQYLPESPMSVQNNISYDTPLKLHRTTTGGQDFNFLHSSETSYLSNNTHLYTLPNDLTLRASTILINNDLQYSDNYKQSERFNKYPVKVLPNDLTENLQATKTPNTSINLNQRKSQPNTPSVMNISDSSLNYGYISKKVPLGPALNYRASVNYSQLTGIGTPQVYSQKSYEPAPVQKVNVYGNSQRVEQPRRNANTPNHFLDKRVSVASYLDTQNSQYAKGI